MDGLAAGVTVIVPVWNGRELLVKLFASLRRQTHPLVEILAIDNGSEDGAAEEAAREGARVIPLGANLGFSTAVNRGIGESRTEWLAIVNTDVELAPDWLEKLMGALERGASEPAPPVWFATGKILAASRREIIDGTYDALCRGCCAWRVGHGRADGPEFSQPGSIDFAPLTAALFRAQLFQEVGLLEERFESYLEDIDLGLRCAAAGYKGVYVPGAIGYHQGSATLGRWHPETVRRISRNQLLLVSKHYPASLVFRYTWRIVVAQGLWGLLAARHGAGWAFVRGKLQGLRMFRCLRPRSMQTRSMRACSPGLREILEKSEREIFQVQQRTGFDLYWRIYFLLTAGKAS